MCFRSFGGSLAEQVGHLYLVFVKEPLQVRQMLVMHIQLAMTRKDVDQRVVKDQLHWFRELQVLHVADESCPGT